MSRLTYGIVIFTAFAACSALPAQAMTQPGSSPVREVKNITFTDYLEAVEKLSLDLRSQRLNVTSARAGVSIAGVRPDPELTAGISSYELNSANRPNSSTGKMVGLSLTVETAGKRGARIRSAESNVKLTSANVDMFLHELETQSAALFVDACRAVRVGERKRSSLKSFQDLVRVNDIRYKSGDVGMLELRQTRVEADRYLTEATSASAEAAVAGLSLTTPLGKSLEQVFPGGRLACDMLDKGRNFQLDSLVKAAVENRDDVRASRFALENAQDNIRLARANRWVDPTFSLGVTSTPQVSPVYDAGGNQTNSSTLAGSTSLGFTVTIPIPISRLQRGELIQAETATSQAELQLRSTLVKVETEVRSAHIQYLASLQNVRKYAENVLKDADQVLEGVKLSYRKGAASLLELLNAQRTADEVYMSYVQAQADLANSTVKLQLSAGLRPEL